jgi:hypothetical protein
MSSSQISHHRACLGFLGSRLRACCASPTRRAGVLTREIANAAVCVTQPVPMAEVQAIVAAIEFVVPLMMAGRDQPSAQRTGPHEAREYLPPHMVRDAHHRHDRQHDAKTGNMNRNEEDQQRNDYRTEDGWRDAARAPA